MYSTFTYTKQNLDDRLIEILIFFDNSWKLGGALKACQKIRLTLKESS